ncbi:GNAT family N-acetyltransferase [Shewanella maritima]|uniref:GNAT family N-acetyltransferase n=1 Tax=Shewanella maritima TaxID=2520507 RepID=A0A411PG63_9GAMM|nr:GNAT family N-acetyltransferase [Shewanella maritima]QBF82577.1 GNAT family N-acetyltransferase [Shewanella maritima]
MLTFKLAQLDNPQVIALLEEHLEDMQATSPPESKHALDLGGLRGKDIQFWSLWQGELLAGFAAYKRLDDNHAELKSMRTSRQFKQRGIATKLLLHILNEATLHAFKQISLETGTMEYFAPARALYLKHGFNYCEPFADYQLDPNSCFMTREIV